MDIKEIVRLYSDGQRNFSHRNLEYIDLCKVNLKGANLESTSLKEANLREIDLSRANLCRSNLEYADLRNANLQGANLTNATLKGANLQGANLTDTIFNGANLELANLSGAIAPNLQGAKLNKWTKVKDGGTIPTTKTTTIPSKPSSEGQVKKVESHKSVAVSTPTKNQATSVASKPEIPKVAEAKSDKVISQPKPSQVDKPETKEVISPHKDRENPEKEITKHKEIQATSSHAENQKQKEQKEQK
jgi:hypothetical protein